MVAVSVVGVPEVAKITTKCSFWLAIAVVQKKMAGAKKTNTSANAQKKTFFAMRTQISLTTHGKTNGTPNGKKLVRKPQRLPLVQLSLL